MLNDNHLVETLLSLVSFEVLFLDEFLKYTPVMVRKVYTDIIVEMKTCIYVSDLERFKNLSSVIDLVTQIKNPLVLKDCCNKVNVLRETNFIIMACKLNKPRILEYLLDSDNRILRNVTVDIGKTAAKPTDTDETKHNAFYYAIHSNNTHILDMLINRWPGIDFKINPDHLDSIISTAYEELILKNVPLMDQMVTKVETKLLDLRFYASHNERNPVNKTENVKIRIELISESVTILNEDYLVTKRLNAKLLFVLKSITRNIRVLKRQIRSTYDSLPWEEIEFCLDVYIVAHADAHERHSFYKAVLTTPKMIKYLRDFSEKLEREYLKMARSSIDRFVRFPELNRRQIVANVRCQTRKFDGLYEDFARVRDFHSLKKISDAIDSALSSNPDERTGKMIAIRALQVIGDHLRNTVESPKLSTTMGELILMSLSKNTKSVIASLTRSPSRIHSLTKRVEIEENSDETFFERVKDDLKFIGEMISDISFKNQIEAIELLLKDIIDNDQLDDILDNVEELRKIALDENVYDHYVRNFRAIERCVQNLDRSIRDKTKYESNLLRTVKRMMDGEKIKVDKMKIHFVSVFIVLKRLTVLANDGNVHNDAIELFRLHAKKTSELLEPRYRSDLKRIVASLMTVCRNVSLRTVDDTKSVAIDKLTSEILFRFLYQTGDSDFLDELKEEGLLVFKTVQTTSCIMRKRRLRSQLKSKFSELKKFVKENDKIVGDISLYYENKSAQAMLEALLLDVLTILETTDNTLLWDFSCPIINGKCLLDYLCNDGLSNDEASAAVVLNAKILTSCDDVPVKKLGKMFANKPVELRNKFRRNVKIFDDQISMYTALERGSQLNFPVSWRQGADIKSRDNSSWTALHFAAKGPNLELVKFVLTVGLDVDAETVDGKHSVHVAAAYGRTNVLNYFIRHVGVYVDIPDNEGNTPLHYATKNGRFSCTRYLLLNGAKTNVKNAEGFSPIHYAIQNYKMEVFKLILMLKPMTWSKKDSRGYSLLHIAAEMGRSCMVEYLLKEKAKVNAANDQKLTPLHAAALNGFKEVARILLSKNALPKLGAIDGCTPLHYAVQNDHDTFVNVLLGYYEFDDVDPVDGTLRDPLQYAAQSGNEAIIEALLKKVSSIRSPKSTTPPLFLAIRNGHREIVDILVKADIDIFARDEDHNEPLHCAVESNDAQIVTILIKKGATVNATNLNRMTPLHVAARNGHSFITNLLLHNKADVTAGSINGNTALHVAAASGNEDVVGILIKNNADVEATNHNGATPLHEAVVHGHTNVVKLLIKNGAKVDGTASSPTLRAAVTKGNENIVDLLITDCRINIGDLLNEAAQAGRLREAKVLLEKGTVDRDAMSRALLSAVKCNNKDIIKVLVANGADVRARNNEALFAAVLAGFYDVVEILLSNGADVNSTDDDRRMTTPLHLAVEKGHQTISAILVANGADVNAATSDNLSPLFFAARHGHEIIAAMLLENEAYVDNISAKGDTALHVAAARGHRNVVKVLSDRGADVNITDARNKTPLELAVARGHLEITKILLRSTNVECDGTILHVASQQSNWNLIVYLTSNDCDINAIDSSGSKAVHVAARKGRISIVEYFLGKGLKANERGANNRTLLHEAATTNQLILANNLIARGADLNATDADGLTPLHIAAARGNKCLVDVLLANGAIYDTTDASNRKPADVTKNGYVKKILESTEQLFEAIIAENLSDVKHLIKAGAAINVKDSKGATPLHYAAWKGNEDIVTALLKSNNNIDAVDNEKYAPLHYATIFAHHRLVTMLLSKGATYNGIAKKNKTPAIVAVDTATINLLRTIDRCFKDVKTGSDFVFKRLERIDDVDTVKAIMSAKDAKDGTLIVAAMRANFEHVNRLKEISQGNAPCLIYAANAFVTSGLYKTAQAIFERVLERRKAILGPDNPGTLDIQSNVAELLCKRKAYKMSLNLYEEIFQKRQKLLGFNHADTLRTRSEKAMVMVKLGVMSNAFGIFQKIYRKQKDLLGVSHADTLATQFHMILVLVETEKYHEALIMNKKIFEEMKKKFGLNHSITLRAQNNIAVILARQGRYEKALKYYEEVLENKKFIFGIHHPETVRTSSDIAEMLYTLRRYNESEHAYQDLLKIQEKRSLGSHPEILANQYKLANVFFAQGRFILAYRMYKTKLERIKRVYGKNSPFYLNSIRKMEIIKYTLPVLK